MCYKEDFGIFFKRKPNHPLPIKVSKIVTSGKPGQGWFGQKLE
jgi:hypothetical protein